MCFIAVVSTASPVLLSINYLRLQVRLSQAKISQGGMLWNQELAQLREDNDAYYSEVTSNVDLNKIKKIAIGRLGMKNPSDDQADDL